MMSKPLKLFALLTAHAETAVRAGEMELIAEPQSITFTMLMEQSVKEDIAKAIVG